MIFEKNRKRRIIYNDDADQRDPELAAYYGYRITDVPSFIQARTAQVFDTQVDTYVWCVGNGAEPPFNREILPFFPSADAATAVIVEACHAQGIEVWGSLRMNDIHDNDEPSLKTTAEPIKWQHPEYLIVPEICKQLPPEVMESGLWTSLNYENPEVRRYRLAYIEQNASAHDFDGYELDFSRFIWHLPMGRERISKSCLTALVRDVRSCLDRIAAQRDRPYTLAVRVFDSLQTSADCGLDVVQWLEEGLVDILVAGYMPFAMNMREWARIGEKYGVPVYPFINTNLLTDIWKNKFRRPEAFTEALRGCSAHLLDEGADGIYLFNLFCQQDQNIGPLSEELTYAALKEIGDWDDLLKKDKIFWIDSLEVSQFFCYASEPFALPAPLDVFERKLYLPEVSSLGAPEATYRLNLHVSGAEGGTVWVRLNRCLIGRMKKEGDLYVADIPDGMLQPARNELAVWCDRELARAPCPMILREVFLTERFGPAP